MMRAVLVTSLILCVVKGQINQFEQECNILQTLEALQSRLQEQEADLAETKSSLTDAFTRLQDQDTEISNLKNTLTVLSRPSQNKTAFTARLSSHITGLGAKQTIVFDDVVTNINDCYSATTGIFTASTNGTFFFFASILSYTNERVQTEMVKNGERVALTYGNVPESSVQGVNGAVLDLTEGDKVWVRQNYGDKLNGYGWCSFSGVQIQ